MVRLGSSILLASLLASTSWAQTCDNSNQCPEDKPCCSQYGECGTGAYCLGGCDPLSSFSLDSCVAEPICQNKTYSWDNLDNAALNTKYLGNATKYDWVYSGFPKIDDGNLVMTMPNGTVGTLFANNHYIWYGKIKGKIKSSRGAGVVTAFILLSDTKDEIDFEFVGADLDNVQTNYYFKGILDYNNGGKSEVGDDNTFEEWHEYEIDWTEDYINWSVNGEVKRTLEKSETWNETAGRYQFPQTPSRMQLSLWPAGQASNAEGTIEWAGGEIDWNSEDIQDKGYYYASFSDITVECYSPPGGADIQGDKSYIFKDDKGLNTSVQVTNNDTVLASFGATGLDPDIGADKDDDDKDDNSEETGNSDSVPKTNGGTGNEPGSDGSSDSQSQKNVTTNAGTTFQGERVMQSSLFGVFVALLVLITL